MRKPPPPASCTMLPPPKKKRGRKNSNKQKRTKINKARNQESGPTSLSQSGQGDNEHRAVKPGAATGIGARRGTGLNKSVHNGELGTARQGIETAGAYSEQVSSIGKRLNRSTSFGHIIRQGGPGAEMSAGLGASVGMRVERSKTMNIVMHQNGPATNLSAALGASVAMRVERSKTMNNVMHKSGAGTKITVKMTMPDSSSPDTGGTERPHPMQEQSLVQESQQPQSESSEPCIAGEFFASSKAMSCAESSLSGSVHCSQEIELTVVNPLNAVNTARGSSIESSTTNDPNAPVNGSHRPYCPININHAFLREGLAIFFLISIIAVAGVIWDRHSVSHDARDQDLARLDCKRLNSLPLSIFVLFFGYLCTSTVFRPSWQNRIASLQHRNMFAKITSLLACFTALQASILIGHPQDVCSRNNCLCGLCLGSYVQNLVENKLEVNMTCRPERIRSSEDTSSFCKDQNLVHVDNQPKACGVVSTPNKMYKLSIAPEILRAGGSSTSLEVNGWMDLLLNSGMVRTTGVFLPLDRTCSKAESICPRETALFESLVDSVLIPGICDSMFRFCDQNDTVRDSCPQTICCSMCNIAASIDSCNAAKQDSRLREMEDYVMDELDEFLRKFRNFDLSNVEIFESLEDFHRFLSQRITQQIKSLRDKGSYFDWDVCMANCTSDSIINNDASAGIYAQPPQCLDNSLRAWYNNQTSSEKQKAEQSNEENSSCDCDGDAKAWADGISWLHRSIFLEAAILVGVQAFISVKKNFETLVPMYPLHCVSRALSSSESSEVNVYALPWKRHVLAWVLSIVVLASLLLEMDYVASASSGPSCANDNLRYINKDLNVRLMGIWLSMGILAVLLVNYTLALPLLRLVFRKQYTDKKLNRKGRMQNLQYWSEPVMQSSRSNISKSSDNFAHRRKDIFSSLSGFIGSLPIRCAHQLKSLRRLWDATFSFKYGRYYVHWRIFFEFVENLIQHVQLESFAASRAKGYIYLLSTVLIMNGSMSSLPLLLAKIRPRQFRDNVNLMMVSIETVFDVVCFFTAVYFTDKTTFLSESWGVASVGTIGILYPVASLARRRKKIIYYAKENIFSSEPLYGRHEAHRGGKAPHHLDRHFGAGLLIVSLVVSLYSMVIGSYFLNMARLGNADCTHTLGDAIWEVSTPQLVIIRSSSGYLRGECNVSGIKEIDGVMRNAPSDTEPMWLPSALSRAESLERIRLVGYNVASEGVPLQIFKLRNLKVLEFGPEDPANSSLDFSRDSGNLDFLGILRFESLTNHVESLNLSGCILTCLPPVEVFSRLQKLRELDVSNTAISYIAPYLLFNPEKSLNLHLSGTPVYTSLDWSHHNLGALNNFTLSAISKALPNLVNLNVSGNNLNSFSILDIDSLPHLRSFDISDNPKVVGDYALWWDALSNHQTLGRESVVFLGLANTGLTNRVFLKLTCWQLLWLGRLLKPSMPCLDLRRNPLGSFSIWDDFDSCPCVPKENHDMCPVEPEERYEAILRLISHVAPGFNAVHIDMDKVLPENTLLGGNTGFRSVIQALEGAQSMKSLRVRATSQMNKIPVEIGSLKSLRYLNLRECNLEGEIPDAISRLTNLVEIRLDNNKLSGHLPKAISSLTNLQTIDFGNNTLSGSIPQEIQHFKKLTRLDLGYNTFTTLPESIGKLSNLRELNVRNNKLSGNLIREISKLISLAYLSLRYNSLSGRIPHALPASLERIDLTGNYFTGQIPPGLYNCTKLEQVQFSDNKLSGNLSEELGNLVNLRRLELGKNQINSAIPSRITLLSNLKNLAVGYNLLSGNLPHGISALTRLEVLRLGHNSLTGDIPSSLYDLVHLEYLDLSKNNLQGIISVKINNLKKLEVLDLSDNNLQNIIPPTITQLTEISRLRLQWNRLSGSIPNDLQHLTQLKDLRLNNNELEGSLPESLFRIQRLEELRLEFNKFSSMPDKYDCTRLSVLYLHQNRINGLIPKGLSRLENLERLNLRYNNFSGQLPKELSHLSHLKALQIIKGNNIAEPHSPINHCRIRGIDYECQKK